MDDPVNWLKPEETERHRAQRAEHGFSVFDWWNFSEYLTWVIVQGLEKFKTDGHGFPCEYETMDAWRDALDVMLDGFAAQTLLHNDGPERGQDWEEWAAPLREKWETGSALFVKHYGALWD